ncbi:MAG: cobalt-precorrin 5A hydrolase [Thermodesulforhabdaceae bacterium]|jgi:cobalt-precorrin 5A hydrolase
MDSEKLTTSSRVAVVAITRKAADLAVRLANLIGNAKVYLSRSAGEALPETPLEIETFTRVVPLFRQIWNNYQVIVCIMAAGIVVRAIAPLINKKTTDPAVIVLDEKGEFVISLLSGHIGGANAWTKYIAKLLGATPVITTSSDVKGKIALDLLAVEEGLTIVEHPAGSPVTLAGVMRRLLDDEPLWIFDQERRIAPKLLQHYSSLTLITEPKLVALEASNSLGIWVSEEIPPGELNCLRMHPRNLLVGVGCNRGTTPDEIVSLIEEVFRQANLFTGSIRALVTVEIKQKEKGLHEAARMLGVPISFISPDLLRSVTVPNPSQMVEKHIGVKSVCEAAPIALVPSAQLIIPKHKTRNVTVAVARVPFP